MLNKFLFIVFLLIITAAAGLWQVMQQAQQQLVVVPEEGMEFHLKAGTSAMALLNDLQYKGMIETIWPLKLSLRLDDTAAQIKAGKYHVKAGITVEQLFALFISGKTKSYSITFIEGWNFKRMLAELRRNPNLQHDIPDDNARQVLREQLGIEQVNPEGLFLPETYYFEQGTADIDVLARAHKAMQQFLENEWQGRALDLPLKDAYQALVLASIIEKETGQANERSRIAGVFVRRLRKNMRLQTDPTVIYGMGDTFDGNLRRRDLRRDTPYNTYVHKGLPPTPIAMPGKASIRAAMHPDEEDSALYFVARGDGSHYFSSSLEEHQQAVRKYQLKK